MKPRLHALSVTVVAALATGACSLNQRLVATRAPYGLNDLVFVPDRKLELQACKTHPAGEEPFVWARFDVVFVPGGDRSLRSIAYRLEESADDSTYAPVTFAYELHRLTKPEQADRDLTVADKKAAADNTVPLALQQTEQKQKVQAVTKLERREIGRDEWSCKANSASSASLSFEGNRLLGTHTVALVAAAGGMRTGKSYRLSFMLPLGEAAPAALPDRSPAPAPSPEGAEVGAVEFRLVRNSNLIGVPVGTALIIGFLVVTTML